MNISLSVQISFSAPECTNQLRINAPDFGGVYIPGDSFPIQVSALELCDLSHNLTVSDGRTFLPLLNTSIGNQEKLVELNSLAESSSNSEAVIEGWFYCGDDSLYIKTKILTG